MTFYFHNGSLKVSEQSPKPEHYTKLGDTQWSDYTQAWQVYQYLME